MAVVVCAHPLLRKLYDSVSSSGTPEQSKAEDQANARLRRRVHFDLVFAFCFLLVLHGSSAIKVFSILYINYLLAKRLPRSMVPGATWIFNIAILFSNELCHGYPYSDIARFITIGPFGPGEPPSASWGTWLDSYGGLIPRWEILFNITVLRLISFNLDYYWAVDKRAASPVEVRVQADFSQLVGCLLTTRRNN